CVTRGCAQFARLRLKHIVGVNDYPVLKSDIAGLSNRPSICHFKDTIRMFACASTVFRSLSLMALVSTGAVHAMEFPLPPPHEDVVGQVQVIKARYED